MLSLGGGGGNILRSVKALYRRDLAVTEQADPTYAARLKDSVATRFVDTNRFSLMDIPDEERVMIGAATTRHLGAGHDPDVARRAFEESKGEIAQLIAGYSTVILIATGGKGTGTGTMLPAALLARQQRKLVIPIFIRPSFERHEVEKRRYDQALDVSRQLDAAQIRFIELLNDRGYVDADPQPQSVVWERMNVPIARALRGLLYVLWDLSQVDPSDLSALFAGPGRLRIGFSELAPQSGSDPSDETVDDAVQKCWDNAFCNFSAPVGTSLICIQGPWSNVADAKIKSGIAAHASAPGRPFTILFTHARPRCPSHGASPRCSRRTRAAIRQSTSTGLSSREATVSPGDRTSVRRKVPSRGLPRSSSVATYTVPATRPTDTPAPLGNFWDLALAINRSDAHALEVAQNGANASVRVDPTDLRKLLANGVVSLGFPALVERVARTLAERPGRHRRCSESRAETRPPRGPHAGHRPRGVEGAVLEVVGDRSGSR